MIAQAGLFDPVESLSSWYLCLDSKELQELLMRNLDKAGTADGAHRCFQDGFSS